MLLILTFTAVGSILALFILNPEEIGVAFMIFISMFMLLHWSLAFYFMWFIHKEYPAPSNRKTNDILIILILGIFGMWYWVLKKEHRVSA